MEFLKLDDDDGDDTASSVGVALGGVASRRRKRRGLNILQLLSARESGARRAAVGALHMPDRKRAVPIKVSRQFYRVSKGAWPWEALPAGGERGVASPSCSCCLRESLEPGGP